MTHRLQTGKDGNALPEKVCLNCGKSIDAVTRTVDEDDDRPSPGDVAICFYCGHLMVYAADMSMRETAGDRDVVEGMRMRAVTRVEFGVYGFVCVDCGQRVAHLNPWDEPPRRAVCSVREFIREFGKGMPEAEKRKLRERG